MANLAVLAPLRCQRRRGRGCRSGACAEEQAPCTRKRRACLLLSPPAPRGEGRCSRPQQRAALLCSAAADAAGGRHRARG